MSRKSTALLELESAGLVPATEPMLAPIEYPEEIATEEEKAIYARIMEANPSAHLFSRAIEGLLVQYVRHQISANKIAEAIRRCRDPKLLIALAKSQKDESTAMSMLAVKLKMTPTAISNTRSNLLPTHRPKPKPWEWDGSKEVA